VSKIMIRFMFGSASGMGGTRPFEVGVREFEGVTGNAESPETRRQAGLGASMVGHAESVRTSNPKTTPGQ
jgi:hypothetical protein